MNLNIAKLDALLEQSAPQDGPGAVLGILHRGQLAYLGSRGLASVENPSPLTPKSIFNTGSLAKQFTAYCIFLLQRQKKLSLEDEVRRHLPELPSYGRPMRIRHLLWHTSGLRCYLTLLKIAGILGSDSYSRKQALELVFRQKELNFLPGEEYLYGNGNYLLLSEIVERLSGRSLADFAARAIFQPLGMKATHFREDPGLLIKGLVQGHHLSQGALRVDRAQGALPGVGRLMTNAEDLLKWDRFFQKPGESALPILRSMLSPGWLDSGQKIRYGGGLLLQRFRGQAVQRHDGNTSGCRAEFCRFPDAGLTLACLSNHGAIDPTWITRQAAALILGKALEPVSALGPGQPAPPPAKASLSRARLKELGGLYQEAGGGAFLELVPGERGLRTRSASEKHDFLPESPTGFQGQGPSAICRLDLIENGGFILIKQGRARRFEPVKAQDEVAEAKIGKFAGRYACPETLSRLDFSVEKGRLWAESSTGARWPLQFLKGGHFYGGFMDHHFSSRGMVMNFSGGWVRRLKWVRL